MRINLIFAISLMAIMQVSANSFGQRININEKNASLSNVLKSIRSQSGYDVLFDAKVIQNAPNVSVYIKDATIEEALNKCLEGLNLTYKLEDHTVIVKEKSMIEKLTDFVNYKLAVNEIKGYVYANRQREPLAGANVMVKRTKRSVLADQRGTFTINDVLPTDSLVISFIGYQTKTIAVGQQKIFSIYLEEAVNELDVMVVQGYGKTTQRLATGNIVRVGASEIGKQLLDNPLLALQGAVPGLEITNITGNPFSGQRIELRGRKSINSNFSSEPLIIIDGVPQTVLNPTSDGNGTAEQSVYSSGMVGDGAMQSTSFSPLYGLNPNDIESIEVLIDADATAIYGSRGGNGVILITTKRGKAGKTDLNVRVDQGLRGIIKEWDLLDTEQYLEMRRETFRNSGVTPTVFNARELLAYDQTRYTDWQKMNYGNLGRWTNYDATLTGGSAQTTFRLSSSLNRTIDITKVKGLNQRFSGRASLKHTTEDKKLSFDFGASFGRTNNTGSSVRSYHLAPPNGPSIYDDKGGYNFTEWQTTMSEFTSSEVIANAVGGSFTSQLQLTYKPLKNLTMQVLGGYKQQTLDSRTKTPIKTFNPLSPIPPTPTIQVHGKLSTNNIVEPQINYQTFLGRGTFSALIGGSYQYDRTNSNHISTSGYTSDEQMSTINNATTVKVRETELRYKYAGVFARLNYNYASKYIVNFNLRRDGSSRFGADHRYGNFGAVGASWIITEESFIKRHVPKAISFAKLRGSYGVVGGDGIGDYKYFAQWGSNVPNNLNPLTSYDGISPVVPQLLPNSELRWQRNIKAEAAFNLGLFDDKLGLDVAYYRDRINNQLLSFQTPLYTGFAQIIYNLPAEVQNSGLSVNVRWSVFNRKNFGWATNFTYSKNANKLAKYDDIENSPYYARYIVGQSLNNTYRFKGLGVNPATGEFIAFDANGDGVVKANYAVPPGTADDDRIVAINTSPEFSGGMIHTFRYKSFNLSAQFYYSKRLAPLSNVINDNSNTTKYLYNNTWHKPGDNAIYPRYTLTSDESRLQYQLSDATFTDGSFIRLKNLQLAYTAPGEFAKKLGLKNLSINVTGQNILLFTKYPGIDPEITSAQYMPQTRVVTMGLNCTF